MGRLCLPYSKGENMIDYDLDYDEWLSICCYAPPMFELHIDDGVEPSGICSQCRDNTTFINEQEEE